MKNTVVLISMLFLLFSGVMLPAQTLMPVVVFLEDAATHNMHIASDGQYLYTCNGGVADEGMISKYTLTGEKIASYKVSLDMRSIMYNPADKKLYVSTYDKNIYKVNDLMMGKIIKVLTVEERDGQSTPAIDPKGRYICYFEGGSVFMYDLKTGKLKKTINGLDASTDNLALAMDEKYFYTWDFENKTIQAFDKKGKYKKSFKVNQGDYSFSLSFANGFAWVSTDGNYDTGTWYAYKLW